MNPLEHITSRLAKKIYVILMKDDDGKLTLLVDTGLNRPWCANSENVLRNKKLAEFHAHECGGMAATYEDAFSLLKKANPNFEKKLVDNLKRKARIVESSLSKDQKTGIIYDKHGNPVSSPRG